MLKFYLRTSVMVVIALVILAISPTITKKTDQAETVQVPSITAQTQQKNVMVASVVAKKDDRAERLEKYFRINNSPFASYSVNFIEVADKYDLDWTLLPAIANLESQLGKQIPAYSYNSYGWNNGNYRFQSWSDANDQVALGLRTRYVPVGEVTAYRIGRMYAANPNWAARVTKYQNIILNFN